LFQLFNPRYSRQALNAFSRLKLKAICKRALGARRWRRSPVRAWGPEHGRLMLTVLGGLAEFERELIRARTR
jgi:hypothetical protein